MLYGFLLTLQVSAKQSRSLPLSLTSEKGAMPDPTSFSYQLPRSRIGSENSVNSPPISMSTHTTDRKANEPISETISKRNSEAVNFKSYSLPIPKWSLRMISAFSGKRLNFNRASTTRATSLKTVRPKPMSIYYPSNLDGGCS